MNDMRKYMVWVAALTLISACSTLSDNHTPVEPKHGNNATQGMDHKKDFFVAHKGITSGYEMIFHVMPAPEGTGFSRSLYHLMVSVQKNGQPVTNLKLYSSAKHPDGSVESKMPMMLMGDWYMALYNLSHEQGQHWLTVPSEQAG